MSALSIQRSASKYLSWYCYIHVFVARTIRDNPRLYFSWPAPSSRINLFDTETRSGSVVSQLISLARLHGQLSAKTVIDRSACKYPFEYLDPVLQHKIFSASAVHSLMFTSDHLTVRRRPNGTIDVEKSQDLYLLRSFYGCKWIVDPMIITFLILIYQFMRSHTDCICVAISAVMAAIPYGALAACKAMKKESDTDMKVSRIPKYEPKFENRKVYEYTPVKYNGKMMNRWVVI